MKFDQRVEQIIFEMSAKKSKELFLDLSKREFHHASKHKFDFPKAITKTNYAFLTYGPGFYFAPMESDNKGWGDNKYKLTFKEGKHFLNIDAHVNNIEDILDIFPDATGKFARFMDEAIDNNWWSKGFKIKDFIFEATYKNKIAVLESGIKGIYDEGLEGAVFDVSIIDKFEPIN